MIGVLIGLAVSAVVLYAAMRRGLLFLVFWMGLCLTGCNTAWVSVDATAKAATVAVGAFKAWDRTEAHRIVTAHHECKQAPDPRACFKAALAPLEQRERPVLQAAAKVAPVLSMVGARVGDPDALAAQLGAALDVLLGAIAEAKR